MLIAAVGMLIMGSAVLLYTLLLILKVFGFVKNSTFDEICTSTTLDELGRYKEMLHDKILTEDEFDKLKQKVLSNAESRAVSMDDLKKWKN